MPGNSWSSVGFSFGGQNAREAALGLEAADKPISEVGVPHLGSGFHWGSNDTKLAETP
jgi:hypothetical protein